MHKIYFLLFLFMTNCVETVVLGTIATGAYLASDGNLINFSEDDRIESAIKKDLKSQNNYKEYKNIESLVYNSKILMVGYVNDVTYKEKAIQAAKNIKNGLEVVDEIMVFNSNYKPSSIANTRISGQISLQLKGAKGISSGNYEYAVIDNIVFIIGSSKNSAELEIVLDIIRRTAGVKKVISYITINKMVNK